MQSLLTALHKVLGGTSPVTGYIGSLIVLLDVAQQAFVQGGMPHDVMGWIVSAGAFLTGLGIRFAKDANKSNAPNPVPTPKTVS